MSDAATHRARLRRLRILQTLAQVAPNPMGELALLARLRADPELQPTVELVRDEMRYLADIGLVQLITAPGVDWIAAHIHPDGERWLREPGDHGHQIHSPDYLPQAANNRNGRVSAIDLMDTDAKAWLDQSLVERNFTGYTDMAEQLKARGYEISRSAIHRYGTRYKAELAELRQTVEMAKGFAEVVGDDAGALAQTLTGLLQQEAISIIREGRYQQEGIELPKLIQAVSGLNKADIGIKKYAAEVKRKAAAAAAAAEKTLAKAGASAETAAAIKREILGIA